MYLSGCRIVTVRGAIVGHGARRHLLDLGADHPAGVKEDAHGGDGVAHQGAGAVGQAELQRDDPAALENAGPQRIDGRQVAAEQVQLVGLPVAVVVVPVAGDFRHRDIDLLAGQGPLEADGQPFGAQTGLAGHGAVGAAAGVVFVDAGVAVIVQAVAGLRRPRMDGEDLVVAVRGGRAGGAQRRAVHVEVDLRTADRQILVHQAVAVVVEAVAELGLQGAGDLHR